MSRQYMHLKLIAGASAAVLIGWAAGVGAQTPSEPTPPPLPPATQAPASPPDNAAPAPAQQQTEVGPATIAAAQQYNENRGGSGPVPIDGALLARLQQDTGPRLTPEQVAARSQPRYQPRAPSNPLVGAMQQFESNLRGLFNGGY
jgi:hypothetical protein